MIQRDQALLARDTLQRDGLDAVAAGRHRNVIAATGANRTHADHQRDLPLGDQSAEVMIEIIAARDRAAGRVNSQHRRDDVLVIADSINLLLHERPVEDGALDLDNGDLGIGMLIERMVFLLRPARLAEIATVAGGLADDYGNR